MALENFSPFMLRVFGGLCKLINRLELPFGLSPDCKNVRFEPGLVRSREALVPLLASLGNPVTSFIQGVRNDGGRRIVTADSAGQMFIIQNESNITRFSNFVDPVEITGRSIHGTVLYDKLHFTHSNGKNGVAGPWVWDQQTGDPTKMSPSGPGPGLVERVTIGSVLGAGSMPASGYRHFAICYVTKSGYVTPPEFSTTPVNVPADRAIIPYYTAGLNALPLGPPGTVARMIFISFAKPALTSLFPASEFFHLSSDVNFNSMLVGDNTSATIAWKTATIGFQFTESELASGTPLTDFMGREPISAPGGMIVYNDRILAWGLRGWQSQYGNTESALYGQITDAGCNALRFDSGIRTAGPSIVPSGWSNIAGPSGTAFVNAGPTPAAFWQFPVGAGPVGVLEYDGQLHRMLQLGKTYGIRIRLRCTVIGGGSGTIRVELGSYNPGWVALQTVNTTVSVGKSPVTYEISFAQLTDYGATSSFRIRLSSLGLTNPIDLIDGIEFYDIKARTRFSDLVVSPAGDPEAFDGNTGVITVDPDNGDGVRCCFKLRDQVYICKSHSMYVTNDTSDEPAFWPVEQVSNTVGTTSNRGAAVGDGWAIVAGPSGVYRIDGAETLKLSQEIEPLWRQIDWTYGDKLWVMIDTERQQVKIGVPFDHGYDSARVMFVLDYVEGWASAIPSGSGRKWSVDTMYDASGAGVNPVQCADMIRIEDGSRVQLLASAGTTPTNAIVAGSSDGRFSGAGGPWTLNAGTINYVGVTDGVDFGTNVGWEWNVTALGGSGYAQATLSSAAAPTGSPFVAAIYVSATSLVQAVTLHGPASWTATRISASKYHDTPNLSGGKTWIRHAYLMQPGSSVSPSFSIRIYGTGTIYLAIQQIQLYPYDRGPIDSGSISVPPLMPPLLTPNDSFTNDFQGPIDTYYETAPIGSDIGRIKTERVIYRMRGAGTLVSRWRRPDETLHNIENATLAEVPEHDVEINTFVQGTAFGLRWGTNESLGKWALRRGAVMIDEASYARMRAK